MVCCVWHIESVGCRLCGVWRVRYAVCVCDTKEQKKKIRLSQLCTYGNMNLALRDIVYLRGRYCSVFQALLNQGLNITFVVIITSVPRRRRRRSGRVIGRGGAYCCTHCRRRAGNSCRNKLAVAPVSSTTVQLGRTVDI